MMKGWWYNRKKKDKETEIDFSSTTAGFDSRASFHFAYYFLSGSM